MRLLMCLSSCGTPRLEILICDSRCGSHHLELFIWESASQRPQVGVLFWELASGSPHLRVLICGTSRTWRCGIGAHAFHHTNRYAMCREDLCPGQHCCRPPAGVGLSCVTGEVEAPCWRPLVISLNGAGRALTRPRGRAAHNVRAVSTRPLFAGAFTGPDSGSRKGPTRAICDTVDKVARWPVTFFATVVRPRIFQKKNPGASRNSDGAARSGQKQPGEARSSHQQPETASSSHKPRESARSSQRLPEADTNI